MPPRTMKDVKRVGHGLRPTVHVGKEGVTDTLIEEIAQQVKNRKVVKVRLLPSVEEDRKQVGEDLAARSKTVLIEVVGHTVLLCDRKYLEGKGEIGF
ncbi:MAG TPA: YhbY family RNA-binding protein [Methanomassiliicoccales archaeon]|nr:YhbY family RNA-binding protein [Methanomassiliicoccales archaeon]HNX48310.1 YhbY family RNA-binding protein [Methanomassiliicoccales archaeon]HPR99005.1 YhbY family RNA-binding protein [Methanomassiliicoccales archaeon]